MSKRITKNETSHIVKATQTLILPIYLKKPIRNKPGQLFFNAGNNKFYGATKSGWQAFKTDPDTLAQVLTVSGNAAGKNIQGINTLGSEKLQVTTLTVNSLTISNVMTSTLVAKYSFTNTLTSITLKSDLIETNNVYVGTSNITLVTADSVYVTNLYTGTITASLIIGSSLSCFNLVANQISATNFIWTTGSLTLNNLSATLAITNYLRVPAVTFNSLSSSLLVAKNLFTNTINPTNDIYLGKDLINSGSILTTNITSTNFTTSTLYVSGFLAQTSGATLISSPTIISNNLTASFLTGTFIQSNIIQYNFLHSTSATIKNLYLNNNNIYGGEITATLIIPNVILSTFSSNTLLTNNITATITNVSELNVNTVTASVVSVATLQCDFIQSYYTSGNTMSLGELFMNNKNIYTVKFVGNNVITATLSSITLTSSNLSSANLRSTLSNISIIKAHTVTASIISATLVFGNYLTSYSNSLGTIFSNNLITNNINDVENLIGDSITSTLFTTITLNVENLVGNSISASLIYFAYNIPETAASITSTLLSANNVFVDSVTAVTVTSVSLSGIFTGVFTGTFANSPLERIGYTSTTVISPSKLYTFVTDGVKGRVNWGARVAATSDQYGRGIGINAENDIVGTGYYNQAITIYDAGGTLGRATLPNSGATDVYIAKWDSEGETQWAARVAGVVSADISTGLALNNSGDSVVTGYYDNNISIYDAGGIFSQFNLIGVSASQGFVVKYDSAGSAQWARRITVASNSPSSFGTCVSKSIAQNDNGTVAGIGTGRYTDIYIPIINIYNTSGGIIGTIPISSSTTVTYIVTYDFSGTFQWGARIQSNLTGVTGYDIKVTNLDEVIAVGNYNGALDIYNTPGSVVGATLPNGNDVFIAKWNSYGIVQWVTRIVGASSDIGYGVAENIIGDIFATGIYQTNSVTIYGPGGTLQQFTLPNSGSRDVFVVKYNSSGSAQWATRIAGISDEYGNKIAVTSAGDSFVIGNYTTTVVVFNANTSAQFTLPGSVSAQGFIVKYNPRGVAEWAGRMSIVQGGAETQNISTNSKGDVVITGSYTGVLNIYEANGNTIQYTLPNSGGNDAFIIKYLDEPITVQLPKPSRNGQRKTIISTRPQVTVVPEEATVDNVYQNLFLTNCEQAQLMWDSETSNWIVLTTSGDLVE